MEEFEKASCIRGFHVYQDNWTPILGERLVCKNGSGNPRDQYAVAVCKAGDEIVGHLPRKISTMCLILFGGVELITAQFQGDGNIQGIFHRMGWKEIQTNSLENFHDWRLICKNRKSFTLQTICIIRYHILCS